MEPFLPMLLTLAAMGAVVLGFRMLLRRPRGVSSEDPPGVRTVAIFTGNDPEFFRDDRPDRPYVGIRLFEMLCEGLAALGFRIERRRNVQNAKGPIASSSAGDSRSSWSASKRSLPSGGCSA